MASSFLMNTINTPSDITLPNLIHSNDLTANNPPHDSHHAHDRKQETHSMVRYAGLSGLIHKQSSNFVQSDETGVLSEKLTCVRINL
jgi:hypothetical protein